MSPKQKAFEDMREAGINVSIFNLEFTLCGFRFDGRMTNGCKKGESRKKAKKAKLVCKYNKQVTPFNLIELEGGFVVRTN